MLLPVASGSFLFFIYFEEFPTGSRLSYFATILQINLSLGFTSYERINAERDKTKRQ